MQGKRKGLPAWTARVNERQNSRSRSRGITLLEIVVSLALTGILAAYLGICLGACKAVYRAADMGTSGRYAAEKAAVWLDEYLYAASGLWTEHTGNGEALFCRIETEDGEKFERMDGRRLEERMGLEEKYDLELSVDRKRKGLFELTVTVYEGSVRTASQSVLITCPNAVLSEKETQVPEKDAVSPESAY